MLNHLNTTGRGSGIRRRSAASAVALVALLLLTSACFTIETSEGGFTWGGSIHIPEGEVERDEIVAIGGSVRVDGRARRDVVVIGGSVTLNGVADGDVVCVGGNMRLGEDARIRGDAVVVGGMLNRAEGAQIDGEVVNVGIGGPGFHGFGPQIFMPRWGSWWGVTPFRVMTRTTQLLFWLLLAALTVALAGDGVSSASHSIAREPIRLGAIGVLAGIGLPLMALIVTILLILLCALLIGIPLLIAWVFVLPLGVFVTYVFGMTAVFQLVGDRVAKLLGKPDLSQIGLVLSGALALCVLRFFPFFGTLIWWVAAFLGLGAVFATRFGSNRPWLRAGAPIPVAPTPPPAPAPPTEPAPFVEEAAPFDEEVAPFVEEAAEEAVEELDAVVDEVASETFVDPGTEQEPEDEGS